MKLRDISLVVGFVGLVLVIGNALILAYLDVMIWLFVILVFEPLFSVLGVVGTVVLGISFLLIAYGIGEEEREEGLRKK